MSFIHLINPNDPVEVSKGLVSGFVHTLMSYESHYLIEQGIVKDAPPALKFAKPDAEAFVKRFCKEDFPIVGVYTGPKCVTTPIIAARVAKDTEEAHLTELLAPSIERNFHGHYKHLHDVLLFTLALFEAHPEVRVLHTCLPLSRLYVERDFVLRVSENGACSLYRK